MRRYEYVYKIIIIIKKIIITPIPVYLFLMYVLWHEIMFKHLPVKKDAAYWDFNVCLFYF